ncbi:hypothetical protein D7X96_05175 [Corallococcus interemptor]|uniref:Lipoprotein n=1 Tax=Corallococcus interemptor TaxID=2316720 RepID=A0A3A8RAN1_9BACT|nr:hypothetical protein D7X96_05175 [Corallococcus interemptor]
MPPLPRVLLLSLALLLGCATRPREEAPAAAPLQTAAAPVKPRVIQGPDGITFLWRGNCIIVEIQTQEGVEWDDSACDKNVQGAIGFTYGWLPDRLVRAFLFAESIVCGGEGCASAGRSVRFYVTWSQVPWLRTIHTDDRLEIRMSTALADLVEGYASIYTAERESLKQALKEENPSGLQLEAWAARPDASFSRWLDAIDNHGGDSCQPFLMPKREVTLEEVEDVKGYSLAFYAFAMTHELAHLTQGASCGESADADELTREIACDEKAFNWLARKDSALPHAFIAPMILFAHHQLRLEPLLAKEAHYAPGKSYSDENPAARWQERAEVLMNRWMGLCWDMDLAQQTSDNNCRKGWRAALIHTSQLMAHPLPGPCGSTKSLPRPLIQADPTAARCLRLREEDTDQRVYIRDGDPPVMSQTQRYKNICDRPVRCNLQVAMGTVSKLESEPEQWEPYRSRMFPFELGPGQIHRFAATLEWTADEKRMPSVRYPYPPGQDMDLLACEFTGPPQAPAPSTKAPSCQEVNDLISSAHQRFENLRGRPQESTTSGVRLWEMREGFPDAEHCRVGASETRTWVHCSSDDFTSEDELQEEHRRFVARLLECLPTASAKVARPRREAGNPHVLNTFVEDESLPLWFRVTRVTDTTEPPLHRLSVRIGLSSFHAAP